MQGGQTLSKEEKAKLDVWYTEHASLLLDLKILLLTVRMLILGDARSVYRSGRSATDRPTELVSESLSE